MDDDSKSERRLNAEAHKFLDENVSYLALTQFTGPMREIELILTSVLIDTLIALRSLPLEGEGKQRAQRAWENLEGVFALADTLEKRAGRVFSARHPWDDSGETPNE